MTVLELRTTDPGSGDPKVRAHLPLRRGGISGSEKHTFEAGFQAHSSSVRQAATDEDSLLARPARALLAELANDLADGPFAVVLRDAREGVIDRKRAGVLGPLGRSSVTPRRLCEGTGYDPSV